MAKHLRGIMLMFRDITPTGAGNRAETEGVETCFDGRTGWLPRRRTCARWRGLLCLCGGRGVPGRPVYPQSVIRVQSDFVLPPCRLAVAFVEGVAGYVEAKRQTRCRRQDERAWKAVERLSGTRQGGLMTDLGLSHSGRRYGAVSRRNRRHQGTPRATGQFLPRLLPTVAKLHRFCTRHIHGKPIPVSSHQVREIFRRERTNADTRLGLCQPCRSRRIPYVQAHQRHAGHSTPILTRP